MRFIAFRDSDNRLVPLVVILALILLALWYVFGVAYSAHTVDGTSMLDTLQDGDRLLMTRDYAVAHRGDVVSASVVIDGQPDRILKRVVALGGDTVEVQGDKVWVNGELADWPGVLVGDLDRFHLGPFQVPDGEVYLLGDNRPISLDSRYIGPVELSQINGRAVAVFFPLTHVGRID